MDPALRTPANRVSPRARLGWALIAIAQALVPVVVLVLLVTVWNVFSMPLWGWVAIGVASVAIIGITIEYGRPPWVSLVLAFSFGTYGLAKKQAGVEAVESLTFETLVLVPIAAAYLIFLGANGDGHFTTDGPGHAVLLATTGIGFPSRFALVLRRSATGATFGSLLPYRSPRGPVLICARSVPTRVLPAELGALRQALLDEPWRIRLYHAAPRGMWRPFAELLLRPSDEADSAELRFDPVGHPLPGSTTYPWVRRLREPSYRVAQSARRDGSGTAGG